MINYTLFMAGPEKHFTESPETLDPLEKIARIRGDISEKLQKFPQNAVSSFMASYKQRSV